ncbi:hypothetical protein [Magnetospirillum sp. 64-120]|uniref:hypothetical protein n=1 Tax=Magnetospirillum sp. 64-120 TaxID=1895778 RepID=UPI00092B577D|nr:hypothetical protein [Magnetospirillum sp. 64-120]OJX70870.1 MAG: hypothetical protein BGO92_09715 [Magnetospirillum sp. 64-120]
MALMSCRSEMRGKHAEYLIDAIVVAAPLAIGLCIYLLKRPKTILVNYIIENLWAANFIGDMKVFGDNLSAWMYFTVYAAPDGIWVFSFTYAMILIWLRADCFILKHAFIYTPLSIAASSELMQLYGVVRGTYDPLDLSSYIIGAILALTVSFIRGKFHAD